MNQDSKIYIAGHLGMVGSAIHRKLLNKGYHNFILQSIDELDLTNQQDVEAFFKAHKPEFVILAAAKVGGIVANNTYRAQFIYENIQIQNNIIHNSYLNGVKKMLFLGSSCIYPKNAPQPIQENHLLTGELEYTNEPYAIAKIAGIKMSESYNLQYGTNYISVMPTNLYGPNDNYNLETSHVLPALIRKIHLGKHLMENDWETIRKDLNKRPIEGVSGENSESEILDKLAKFGIRNTQPVQIDLWGSGNPLREFMHADDLADACVFLMENVDFSTLSSHKPVINTHINIGTGVDLSIFNLANLIKDLIGFKGNLAWDASKPDGTYRKLLDVSKLHSLGWRHTINLETGLKSVYQMYASSL